MTETRYWHATCCCNVDVKTIGPQGELRPGSGNPWNGDGGPEMPCPTCGKQIPLTEVSQWEHDRYTAIEDDCKNCGQPIVFLPDILRWLHHEGENVSILEPTYGLQTCEAALVQLLNLPALAAPGYAGKVAEPADTHVTLDLATGAIASASQQTATAANEVTVSLEIDNFYEDGTRIKTHVETTVPPPPALGSDDYEDWMSEFILPHTGTGKVDGDSGYFVKIVSSSDPDLVGREMEFI